MDDLDLQLLLEHPDWQRVLEAYCDLDTHASTEEGMPSGWFDRIETIEGIPTSALTSIHGQLIAMDWLQVEFADSISRATEAPAAPRRLSSGLLYRITNTGLKILERMERSQSENRVSQEPAEELAA